MGQKGPCVRTAAIVLLWSGCWLIRDWCCDSIETSGSAMIGQVRELHEVFVLQGVPKYTFVEPVEYTGLLVALRTPGRCIVIEGPSGIGKTSAAVRAISEAGLGDSALQLSARKKEDVEIISTLPSSLPIGIVLIDDFHRLDDCIKASIADLMKTLADEGSSHSKLIVLGITNAGSSLLSLGKDLANRIEVVRLEANPTEKIEKLIALGEAEMNASINVRDEIVQAAQGSFYLAQMLCHHTLQRAKILESAPSPVTTSDSFEGVKAQVMKSLARSFHNTAVEFARSAKLRPEGRAPYLHLLLWVSQSPSWSINIKREVDRHPQQKGSVLQVATKGFLMELIKKSNDIQRVIHFDETNGLLVIQDPQFIFYLRNLSWSKFAEEVGFISVEFPGRYDFALSFAGADRDIAEALFASLLTNEVEVFYDRNEQHRILAEDIEEYLAPIYSSDALIVVCILGPEYPKRIWTKFESDQFKDRIGSGEVVPIVLKSAPLSLFDPNSRVGYIAWDEHKDVGPQIQNATNLLLSKIQEVRHKRLKAST